MPTTTHGAQRLSQFAVIADYTPQPKRHPPGRRDRSRAALVTAQALVEKAMLARRESIAASWARQGLSDKPQRTGSLLGVLLELCGADLIG
jgi:hypothetical protein